MHELKGAECPCEQIIKGICFRIPQAGVHPEQIFCSEGCIAKYKIKDWPIYVEEWSITDLGQKITNMGTRRDPH